MSEHVNDAALPAVHEQRVPFHDCDPLKIVWHGHYYKYLEIARTVLFHRHALDMEDFIALGYGLLMIETRCRHSYPLTYGDLLRVEARFADVEQRLRISYEVHNVTQGRRSARAWTTLVTTRAGEMLLETPREILDRIHR